MAITLHSYALHRLKGRSTQGVRYLSAANVKAGGDADNLTDQLTVRVHTVCYSETPL